jgi:hypothetical protein
LASSHKYKGEAYLKSKNFIRSIQKLTATIIIFIAVMTIILKQEKTCRKIFMFYSAQPTQLEDSVGTTRELLVDKRFPIPLFQVNRFCKISQLFNIVLLLIT